MERGGGKGREREVPLSMEGKGGDAETQWGHLGSLPDSGTSVFGVQLQQGRGGSRGSGWLKTISRGELK